MTISVAGAVGPDAAPTEATASKPATAVARAKAELNVSIVQSSLAVSISAGNDPLALVYKSAVTSLNETLKGQYGEHAIENAVGQDNTPQGTASRIVALATAFYGAFKQQHVGEDEASVLRNFLDTIQNGVARGFKEARDILGGLRVLNGDIAANVDKTDALVQQGLADFAAAQGLPAPANDAAKAA